MESNLQMPCGAKTNFVGKRGILKKVGQVMEVVGEDKAADMLAKGDWIAYTAAKRADGSVKFFLMRISR